MYSLIIDALFSNSICKYFVIVAGTVIILMGGIIYFQHNSIISTEKELAICQDNRQQELLKFNSEREKAKLVISEQNNFINQFKIDKDNYEKMVNSKEKELTKTKYEKQKLINTELTKDNSSTNQLKIVEKLLEDFSNEVR